MCFFSPLEINGRKLNRMLLKVVTGNGERGTGNREQESGNECTAGNRLRIQHGGQRKRKREQFGEMWGSVTVVNVSFYRLFFFPSSLGACSQASFSSDT